MDKHTHTVPTKFINDCSLSIRTILNKIDTNNIENRKLGICSGTKKVNNVPEILQILSLSMFLCTLKAIGVTHKRKNKTPSESNLAANGESHSGIRKATLFRLRPKLKNFVIVITQNVTITRSTAAVGKRSNSNLPLAIKLGILTSSEHPSRRSSA